jgi:hypothetical protein
MRQARKREHAGVGPFSMPLKRFILANRSKIRKRRRRAQVLELDPIKGGRHMTEEY